MKIIQRHKNCIGCGTCVALCSEFWELDNAGKARPKNGVLNNKTGNFEFEVDEKDFGCNKEAAEACPVRVIELTPDI